MNDGLTLCSSFSRILSFSASTFVYWTALNGSVTNVDNDDDRTYACGSDSERMDIVR